ncbi:MAG: hypothetical protein KTR31_36075 [Myxococcales bacterium]|nr:hypothetical protein [Myxococcales bacterium]
MLSLLASSAFAIVDPACLDLAAAGPPDDYDEQVQQDFLQNYFALSSTLSPQHGPVPHASGRGALSLDLAGVPPLGCRRRLVLAYTKTEETNKTPVIPRIRVTYALPSVGAMTPYVGVAYLPPVRLLGQSTVLISAEAGVGFELGESFQVGARFHATSHRTVAEIASPFLVGDPAFDDLYLASTFGFDAMVGLQLDTVTPYAAVGFTDASTFFYIGDDGVTVNNFHPYAGLTASLGADALIGDQLRFGAELYGAPGGYSLPDKSIESVEQAGRYGRILTARVKVGIEL